MDGGIKGRTGRPSKRSKLPTNSQFAKDRLSLSGKFLPRSPSSRPSPQPLIRMQHHNGLFLILAGSLLFFFFLLCWASWAVIFPSVSSITDTTWLVQIKMHLRIIKKGPSFPPPPLPFLPSSNSTQNILLWPRAGALTQCVPSSGPYRPQSHVWPVSRAGAAGQRQRNEPGTLDLTLC